MASLTPAPHAVVVTPSLVEEGEDETASGLHVVRHGRPNRTIYRGVVEVVGAHVQDGPPVGSALFYTDFVPVGDKHIINEVHIACWEANE